MRTQRTSSSLGLRGRDRTAPRAPLRPRQDRGLQPVLAPPYDVIDAEQRAELEARSPDNVVRIDLPVGDDPYAEAARVLNEWREHAVVVQDDQPAMWALEQDYTGPDGERRTRRGSSRACAWRTMAPAGSAPTSATTRARRRIASSSRGPRKRTCRRSSPCSPTPTAQPGARLRHTEQRSLGARRPTTTEPSTGCGASRPPKRSTPSSGPSTTLSS